MSKRSIVSGFREHFIDKYFAYRRRYVEHVTREAPHRRSWAVASEIARLGFMIFGNVLCASIFWALTAGAAGRYGLGLRWVAFALLALVPTVFATLAARGLAVALGERARAEDRRADPAKAKRP